MANASYIIRQMLGPIWTWEAVYSGVLKANGYGLSKEAAKQAARKWVREAREQDLRSRGPRPR